MKVSDEFTVPLCAIHHHGIHSTGDERKWWQERKIDPLVVANELWQQSREQIPTVCQRLLQVLKDRARPLRRVLNQATPTQNRGGSW